MKNRFFFFIYIFCNKHQAYCIVYLRSFYTCVQSCIFFSKYIFCLESLRWLDLLQAICLKIIGFLLRKGMRETLPNPRPIKSGQYSCSLCLFSALSSLKKLIYNQRPHFKYVLCCLHAYVQC